MESGTGREKRHYHQAVWQEEAPFHQTIFTVANRFYRGREPFSHLFTGVLLRSEGGFPGLHFVRPV
jgi:hypothetical protein